ncbi:TetR/AcrR family transcriptional regulator [Actinomadura darangshiensis]|uniref:TetR/AcrR family transcriptional regulator n=1 Tax=Actinomadura darangshiensis TaxID=705336 RepID=UPI00140A6C9A|nr:TetR/AcrR family transcriptional regulator [Actinomadura darangshiensis]
MAESESKQAGPGLRAAGVRRTRSSILTAARRHLVESGYHRLSLEDVAADAGVTRVTIYRHFDSKLGLLDAIGEDLAQQAGLVARMDDAAGLADPVAAFTAMVRELCRFWDTDPEVFRRLISLSAVDPEAQQVIAGREHWRYQQIGTFVQRLAHAGRLLAPFNVREAAAVIGTVTSFPACDEVATRLRTDLTELDEILLRLLTSVVRLD